MTTAYLQAQPTYSDGTTWREEAKLLASDGDAYHYFGYSLSLSDESALIGAFGDDDNGSFSGAAYLFAWDGTTWVEEAKLLASDGTERDLFGISVSLSGERALVGAFWNNANGYDSGAAYLFHSDGTSWVEPNCCLAMGMRVTTLAIRSRSVA
jgi:hypothetical protein